MPTTPKLCSIPGCGKPHYAKELCEMHYARQRRHKTSMPEVPARLMGPKAKHGLAMKFMVGVAVPYSGDECLIWPFSRTRQGYANMRIGKKVIRVHREVCRLVHGEPPFEGVMALHSCNNGHLGCIAPNHLRWGDAWDNAADFAKTNCTKGERHYRAILAESDVLSIRSMKGKKSNLEIGKIFGVHAATISAIFTGRSWGWLNPPPTGTASS